MDKALKLPPEYETLGADLDAAQAKYREIEARRRAIKRAAIEAAGWTRCCRCFPSCVGIDGYCGCCEFNHLTGRRIGDPDPDFEDTAASPAVAHKEK